MRSELSLSSGSHDIPNAKNEGDGRICQIWQVYKNAASVVLQKLQHYQVVPSELGALSLPSFFAVSDPSSFPSRVKI